jgi:hypothetical protein
VELESDDVVLDTNHNNILRYSSLVMSECGLLLELGSFHRR